MPVLAAAVSMVPGRRSRWAHRWRSGQITEVVRGHLRFAFNPHPGNPGKLDTYRRPLMELGPLRWKSWLDTYQLVGDRMCLAIGGDDQLPAFLVDHAVVAPAEQHQVVHHCLAAVGPMLEVMGVGPGWRPVAAGEPAAFVSHHQRLALRAADRAAGLPSPRLA